MGEPTLALTYNALAARIGYYLGYGRGVNYSQPTWDVYQQESIDAAVDSGLRQFYYPTLPAPSNEPYDWTFLRPVGSTAVSAGQSVIPMPDDFGGIEENVYIKTTNEPIIQYPIKVTGVGRILELTQLAPTTQARPWLCAVEAIKGTTPTTGGRDQMRIFPAADATYTLYFQYYVNPNSIGAGMPYHYGGAEHAETVLASCLAAAELMSDNKRGENWQYYQERLAASMASDRRKKPQFGGYNGDASDRRHLGGDRVLNHWASRVFYNGTLYAALAAVLY